AKAGGFLGRTRRTRQDAACCDRLTRSLAGWVSLPLHRREFPYALRYRTSVSCQQGLASLPRTAVRGLTLDVIIQSQTGHLLPSPAPQGAGLFTLSFSCPTSARRGGGRCVHHLVDGDDQVHAWVNGAGDTVRACCLERDVMRLARLDRESLPAEL